MSLIKCKAILFDMDGTLVNSAACVERIWKSWAHRQGIELSRVLSVSHGRRAIDVLPELAPHLDASSEAMLLDAEELNASDTVEPIAGAAALLRSLPSERWAVVTSAPRKLAALRLRCAGLPDPPLLVCAEDVTLGKPDPAGYLLASKLLGTDPQECLVIEDTPPGILAGRAAGMQVLALSTTFPAANLLDASCVRDLCHVKVLTTEEGLEIELQS
jgi:mannitol-1-/sugar-/sorbitol-6-phosphatase